MAIQGQTLWPGELPPLARLGALGHLDLKLVGAHQVLAGHAEPARSHLLDGALLAVAVGKRLVALGILATFAGVRLRSQPVHGDGQGLVGLGRDRAVAHGTGREPLDDRLDRLDFLDRHRLALVELELEQAAQRAEPLGLLVDHARILLEDIVPAGLGRVLEPEDGLGVEQVELTIPAPLVLATLQEPCRLAVAAGEGPVVMVERFGGDLREADAADSRRRSCRNSAVTNCLVQPDRLEDLGTAITLDRADAHLGHHLDHTLS